MPADEATNSTASPGSRPPARAERKRKDASQYIGSVEGGHTRMKARNIPAPQFRTNISFVAVTICLLTAWNISVGQDYSTKIRNRLARVNLEISHGEFRDNWDSLANYRVPE